MPAPAASLFDRLATTTLVIAESALPDCALLVGQGGAAPALIDASDLAFVMALAAPLADYHPTSFPTLAPPPYDLWVEYYAPPLGGRIGVLLRGRDIATTLAGVAPIDLPPNLPTTLLGGHVFVDRVRTHGDILHLGAFRLTLDGTGRATDDADFVLHYPWEREFGVMDHATALVAPALMSLACLRADVPLVAGPTNEKFARAWARRHKRPLASPWRLDHEGLVTTLLDRPGALPETLCAADDLFGGEPPSEQTIHTRALALAERRVATQFFPGPTPVEELEHPSGLSIVR